MAKRTRHAAHELVEPKYVERYRRKGWLDRSFNINGTWFIWRRTIETERGAYLFGVRDWDGSYAATLEVS